MSLTNPREGLDATDIYYVKVWRKDPKKDNVWSIKLDRKVSASSELGALRSIIETAAAKEMLSNQKEINSIDTEP